jgi:hypothetical protein
MFPPIRTASFGSFAAIGVIGILSYFSSPQSPDEAMRIFVKLFNEGNAQGILKLMHPDVVSDKSIKVEEVDAFLKRLRSGSQKLLKFGIDEKMTSEDNETKRVKVTASFSSPPFSPAYEGEPTLEMTLLWVLEDKAWLLERPLSIRYEVTSHDPYPAQKQEEVSIRFLTATEALKRLGLRSEEDEELSAPITDGNSLELYRKLAKGFPQERGRKGVDPNAPGVDDFLKAASYRHGGFLKAYYADFRTGKKDQREPMPWDMLSYYAQAAAARARAKEGYGSATVKQSETAYRRIISLGRQLLEEKGGVQFLVWGWTLERQGAQEMARLIKKSGKGRTEKLDEFSRVAARRLDILQTAVTCLDDMGDYASLKAAIVAAQGDDPLFRPWGINTLAIYALKGAPAPAGVIKQAGAMVMVRNPVMSGEALRVLDELAATGSAQVKAFIDSQKDWVNAHKIYGAVQSLN